MMSYSGPAQPSKSYRSVFVNQAINFVYKSGLLRLGYQFFSKSLTVINYHRIEDINQPGFDSFIPNISAEPITFAQQLDYVARWFNVVSIKDVVNWLNGKGSLPPYATLITFDDGYLDNYTQAYPILRQHNFPAVIFLTTGHIDTDTPFHWDLAAYSFYHTSHDHILFPDGKEQTWMNTVQRDQVCQAWIESMKTLPDDEKRVWVDRLPEQMGISIPQNYFRNLMMNWDQIREMQAGGIDFGGHTINHPILSRISLKQAQLEIEGSKARIEKELGQPIFSFAYPNGMSADLNLEIQNLVAQAGYQAAFTLETGPSPLREVRNNPYAIRRIFISRRHTLPRFALGICWFDRFRG
jgi:peptidoglycan/xylan/chitin deacetylase (PgdA/CDA1 family)